MGAVKLPTSGRVYLDACAVICSVERHPQFGPLLDELWTSLAAGNVELLTSELSILECFVGPMRAGDQSGVQAFSRAFEELGLQLISLHRPILISAAELRAGQPSLRTPDAIHLATAKAHGVDLFVTNDRRLDKVASVPCLILSNLLQRD